MFWRRQQPVHFCTLPMMLSTHSDDGWQDIDWDEPLDPEAYLAITPPGKSVRGMFFQDIYKLMGEPYGQDKHYIAFKNYPLEDWMRLLVEAAGVIYPELSTRQALRQLGYTGFSSFATSSLGKVFFAFSKDFTATARMISRAFSLVQSYGVFETTVLDDRTAVISMREVWDYADSNYIGIFEASKTVNHYDFDTAIRRSASLDKVELRFTKRKSV